MKIELRHLIAGAVNFIYLFQMIKYLFIFRNIKKSLTKKQMKMNKLILNNVSSVLDESSDEELADNDIFRNIDDDQS
jgi:hypothetical protein